MHDLTQQHLQKPIHHVYNSEELSYPTSNHSPAPLMSDINPKRLKRERRLFHMDNQVTSCGYCKINHVLCDCTFLVQRLSWESNLSPTHGAEMQVGPHIWRTFLHARCTFNWDWYNKLNLSSTTHCYPCTSPVYLKCNSVNKISWSCPLMT